MWSFTQRSHSILRRIILVNLILFLFFLSFSIVTNLFFRRSVRISQDERLRQQTENIEHAMNNHVSGIKKFLYEFGQNPKIVLLHGEGTAIDGSVQLRIAELSEELQLLKRSREDIQDIYLYFRNIDRVISTEGSSTTALFFEAVKGPDGTLLKDLILRPESANSVNLTKAEIGGAGFNLFFYPVRDVVLMIAMNDNILHSYFDSITSDESLLMSLYDGSHIYMTNIPSLTSTEQLELFRGVVEDDLNVVNMNGKKYFVRYRHDADNNFINVVFNTTNTLNARMFRINLQIAVFLAVFLLLDVTVFILLNMGIYSPLKRLVSRFRDFEAGSGKSEYELLEAVMEAKDHKLRTLEETLRDKELDDTSIAKIISDQSGNQKQHLVLQDNEIDRKRDYSVLTCVIENKKGQKDSVRYDNLEQILTARAFDYNNLYTMPSGARIYLLKTGDPEQFRRDLQDVFVENLLEESFCIAGVSRLYPSTEYLSQMYKESRTAFQCHEAPADRIMALNFFDESVSRPNVSFDIDTDITSKLVNFVINGDKKGADERIAAVYLQNEKKPYMQQRQMVFYLLDLLTVILNSKRIAMEDFFPLDYYDFMEQMTSTYNIYYLKRVVSGCYSRLASRFSASQDEKRNYISRYIDEHFADRTISLELLADEMSLSYGYMSRYFRKTFGTSFVDYIHRRRIERAKELLGEGKRKIHHIAQDVGYDNAGTFIKVFRKLEGVTPGQYRNRFIPLDREFIDISQ